MGRDCFENALKTILKWGGTVLKMLLKFTVRNRLYPFCTVGKNFKFHFYGVFIIKVKLHRKKYYYFSCLFTLFHKFTVQLSQYLICTVKTAFYSEIHSAKYGANSIFKLLRSKFNNLVEKSVQKLRCKKENRQNAP